MAKLKSFFLAILALEICLIKAAPNTSRIVGGADAYIGQFPYQASLSLEDGLHRCGGSILNERYVLTTAHCVRDLTKDRYVRVGSNVRSEGGVLMKVKNIIAHEGFTTNINDVALLELEQPLEWTDYVKPIEMATETVPSGEEVIISGFGRPFKGGPISKYLQWNTVTALTTEECRREFPWLQDGGVLCLAHDTGNGVCNGDSGGPAAYQGKLVGVASFHATKSCGSSRPDGFASVVFYRDWIEKNMST